MYRGLLGHVRIYRLRSELGDISITVMMLLGGRVMFE